MKTWRQWPINEIEGDELPNELKSIRPVIKKLYYRGGWQDSFFDKSLAIVGSRRMTRYGREMTEKFVTEMVAEKVTTISGFMYGIDSEVHQKTVELGGTTVAVLGGGLNFLTPIENNDLYSQILDKGGLVISEYEPEFRPTLWTFPQRNRIVAGLASLGVLVIEAGLKSGSLITARLGTKQGKKVWAIPGQINLATSEGTNYLIKENLAKITTEATDILENKRSVIQDDLFSSQVGGMEGKVLEIIGREATTIDEIVRTIGKNVGEVAAVISALSIKGLVEEEAGKIYLRG